MTHLNAKLEAFIEQMKDSEELARHGFALLLKRADFASFFDALRDAGLFGATRNPVPVRVSEEGYVRIPYWSALDYLVAVARLSGETNDLILAGKVISVVRDVSSWRDEEGNVQENYHTSQKFANILGLVPTSVVDVSDVEFISGWLRNRFERMLVSVAIDETVLPRFLSSPDPNDWEKAIAVLKQCIEVDWIDDGPNKTAKTVIEDYWLKRLVSNHADVFGEKVGSQAASAFERQVRVVFSSDIHKEHSTIFRPAIESHAQNHQFREAENIMVEGLRDVLLSWSTHTPQLAMQYTARLISDELEVLRRVGIYVLDKKWDVLAAMYPTVLKSDPFRTGHLHELYNLLKNHFGQVEKNDQAETLRQIRNLPLPSWSETPESHSQGNPTEMVVRRWSARDATKLISGLPSFKLTQRWAPCPNISIFLRTCRFGAGLTLHRIQLQNLSVLLKHEYSLSSLNDSNRRMNCEVRHSTDLQPRCRMLQEQSRIRLQLLYRS